jgi:endo-1,4-beta-xylanase
MRAVRTLRPLPAGLVLLAMLGCSLRPPDGNRKPSAGSGSGGNGSGPGGSTSGSGGATNAGGASSLGGSTNAGGSGGSNSVSSSGGSAGASATGGFSGAAGVTGSGGSSSTAGGAGGTSGMGGSASSSSVTTCSSPTPTSFTWSASDRLIGPVTDSSHNLVSIMEPTVARYNSKYVVYATVVSSAGSSNIAFLTFADWPQSSSSTFYYLDNNPGFGSPHGAPQLLYFTPQKKWYLIYQSGAPTYSTAADPSQATTWTKPATFFSSTPDIVTKNAGSVAWTDFWVICNSSSCFMFFRNDKGFLFRSQTSVGSFPNGFGTPVVAMQSSNVNSLLQGSSVYKLKGTSKYLLIVEAAGTNRYFRSWTSDAIDGTWTALSDTESNPFAGASNVTFSGSKWTNDVGHGQLVRDGYDETLTVDNCKLQFLYQGKDPYATASGTQTPWKLGLLTKTN